MSRGARAARIGIVLALDVVLAGAGAAMIITYFQGGDRVDTTGFATASQTVQAPSPPQYPAPPSADGSQSPENTTPANPEPPPDSGSRVARSVEPAAKTEPVRKGRPKGSRDPAPPSAGPADASVPVVEPRPDASRFAEPPPDLPGEGDRPPPDPDRASQAVRRVVQQNYRQLAACHEQASKVLPPSQTLEGRIDIQFVIMSDGSAADVRPVANSTGSQPLAECVARLIEGWRFPPLGEEIEFVWPFVFQGLDE